MPSLRHPTGRRSQIVPHVRLYIVLRLPLPVPHRKPNIGDPAERSGRLSGDNGERGRGPGNHARELLAGQRTASLNALRGHLAETGLIAPQGAQHAYGLKRVAADGFNENGEIVVPDCVRGTLRSLVGQIDALDEAIRAIDRELAASVATIVTKTSRLKSSSISISKANQGSYLPQRAPSRSGVGRIGEAALRPARQSLASRGPVAARIGDLAFPIRAVPHKISDAWRPQRATPRPRLPKSRRWRGSG
jgi:hypothetical protein